MRDVSLYCIDGIKTMCIEMLGLHQLTESRFLIGKEGTFEVYDDEGELKDHLKSGRLDTDLRKCP